MTRPAYPPRRSLDVGPGQVPRPVVALDIDGTLAAWHLHFFQFAAAYLGREMPDSYGWMGEQSLASYMGMSRTTYRQVKLAFRQGGLKRSMPAFSGASGLTHTLRARGAEVWICTTRPYLRLDNIDPDTRHWLGRQKVQFDGVIFGEHKYRDLRKLVGSGRVVGVLDDLPEMYAQAASLGMDPILRSQPYNLRANVAQRVGNLYEASDLLIGRLRNYEAGER